MITIAAERFPLTRVEPPFDRLNPLWTHTFYTKAGRSARGVSHTQGGTD
jgi:hypothetical protein